MLTFRMLFLMPQLTGFFYGYVDENQQFQYFSCIWLFNCSLVSFLRNLLKQAGANNYKFIK